MADVEERVVDKSVERGHAPTILTHIEGRRRRMLAVDALLQLALERALSPWVQFTSAGRECLRLELRATCRDVEKSGEPLYHLAHEFVRFRCRMQPHGSRSAESELRQMAERWRTLWEVRSDIVSREDIRGGDPVFKGTRLPVYQIAELKAKNASDAELVEAFEPSLTPARIARAQLYVLLFPQRGRPSRSAPWRQEKFLKASVQLHDRLAAARDEKTSRAPGTK